MLCDDFQKVYLLLALPHHYHHNLVLTNTQQIKATLAKSIAKFIFFIFLISRNYAANALNNAPKRKRIAIMAIMPIIYIIAATQIAHFATPDICINNASLFVSNACSKRLMTKYLPATPGPTIATILIIAPR